MTAGIYTADLIGDRLSYPGAALPSDRTGFHWKTDSSQGAQDFHAVDDNSLCTPSGAIDDLPERIYDAVFHQLCAGDPE